MSRFRNLMISTLSIAIGALGLAQPVLGYSQNGDPVGGVVTAVNKLTIVAPYLALAGLILAVSAVIIKKRK